jgi:hypothetical protein
MIPMNRNIYLLTQKVLWAIFVLSFIQIVFHVFYELWVHAATLPTFLFWSTRILILFSFPIFLCYTLFLHCID